MPKEKKKEISYTIALIPEDGTESRAFTGITRSKVILAIVGLLVLGSLVASLLIVLTPLRLLIPGYAQPRYWAQIEQNQRQLDSLSARVLQLDYYNQKLKLLLGATTDSAATRSEGAQKAALAAQDVGKGFKGYALKQTPAIQASLLDEPDPMLFAGSVAQGRLSQGFAPERSHYGIDIATALNEPIGAFADGVVVFADWTNDYGWSIIVQHGGYATFYKHCARILTREGEAVRRGQTIALTGNTGLESSGAHLHFEIWKNGIPVDPLDYLVLNESP
ncbi:MAG: M23 family metallopeptidase [Chloroherpetonaceae bacterium]|nr:M23 family metallopeptidase [Chloroherpetonaceae bacterium]